MKRLDTNDDIFARLFVLWEELSDVYRGTCKGTNIALMKQDGTIIPSKLKNFTFGVWQENENVVHAEKFALFGPDNFEIGDT